MNTVQFADYVTQVEAFIVERFPYFGRTVQNQRDEFGEEWATEFETELATYFGDDTAALHRAIEGYGRFALDAMRLQKKFDKTRCYDNKTYEEAASAVYQNRDYMFSLYLPGILLSHYLWPHHYKQKQFYREKFLTRVRSHGGGQFYDIGVGTGFYSKQMLSDNPAITGQGFDMSPWSLEHTQSMIKSWRMEERYKTNLRNIITEPVRCPAPFVINIEVLEHLEDPQEFLNSLALMLEPGGFGLISVAMTAPNIDHIYLYTEVSQVTDQLERAGFTIVDFQEDPAYEPRKPSDSVPRNAVFIVTR